MLRARLLAISLFVSNVIRIAFFAACRAFVAQMRLGLVIHDLPYYALVFRAVVVL